MGAARDTLIYDDGCPMCTFQSRVLTWLDHGHVIRMAPLSHPEARRIAPDLTPEQLHEAIHCITADGTIHRGARAIRHLGMRLPLLLPVGLLLWFPGVIWFAERIYMGVSRNRHLISGLFGCREACAIVPAREREGDLERVDASDA